MSWLTKTHTGRLNNLSGIILALTGISGAIGLVAFGVLWMP